MVKRDAIPVEMNRPSHSIAVEELTNVCLVPLARDLRVRASPAADEITEKIRAHCDRDFAVSLASIDPETSEFSIEGTGEFAAGGVLVLDELIMSLGPHSVQPAVLTGVYEDEPCELMVAQTPQAAQMAMSRHRFDQIRQLLSELTVEDRKSLLTLLADSAG
jgi:hypothetical protein